MTTDKRLTADRVDRSQLAKLALAAARVGAKVASAAQDEVRGSGTARSTKSSDTDLVTVADRASEDAIRQHLELARPGDRFLGEETGTATGEQSNAATGEQSNAATGEQSSTSAAQSADSTAQSILWVVDPIDGTTNYVYGQPDWAVSVAATQGGTTVAAAVVAPRLGTDYVAALGDGATRNGVPLTLATPPRLSQALIATGFGYDAGRRGRQGAVAAALLPQVRDLRRRGAAALDFCFVADGSVDAFYEVGPQWWDFAAGSLIATESGAALTAQPLTRQADGSPPLGGDGWFLVAAASPLYDTLVDVLIGLGAAQG